MIFNDIIPIYVGFYLEKNTKAILFIDLYFTLDFFKC